MTYTDTFVIPRTKPFTLTHSTTGTWLCAVSYTAFMAGGFVAPAITRRLGCVRTKRI